MFRKEENSLNFNPGLTQEITFSDLLNSAGQLGDIKLAAHKTNKLNYSILTTHILGRREVDFSTEKIRPRLGKRDFEVEKIRPRLGKREDFEVEKIRPRLGKRFGYKSLGKLQQTSDLSEVSSGFLT